MCSFQNWKNVSLNSKLHLPARNEFIPTNFDLVSREEECESPQVIHCSDLTRLWYKQDTKLLLPKACIGIDLTRYVYKKTWYVIYRLQSCTYMYTIMKRVIYY